MARILVVDDSGFQRKKACRVLERAGYETCAAADGQEALKSIEEDPPDFVVTDLNMPNMSGMELLDALQARGSDIPVLVVTSDVQESTREEAIERGAAEMLNKPVSEDRLIVTIQNFLGPPEESGS